MQRHPCADISILMHQHVQAEFVCLQGSAAAAPVLESIAAVQKTLGDSCTSTEQLQTRLGSLLTALESVSGPGKVLSGDGKSWKGPQSKAKRAALVMDAMRDAVTGVVQLVSFQQVNTATTSSRQESTKLHLI